MESTSRNLEVYAHFLGANDGVVTGSATIVKIVRNGVTRNILVDYGLFQGEHEELNDNRYISGDDIDAVLLTHAHLDHCGGIPLLVQSRNGNIPFTGKIYASPETIKQATMILVDTAKINERKKGDNSEKLRREENRLIRKKEKAIRENCKSQEIEALDSAISSIEDTANEVGYTMEEVEEVFSRFVPVKVTTNQNDEVSIFEGIDAKFEPMNHINGACKITLIAHLGDEKFEIVFTGDIGKRDSILYRNIPATPNYEVGAIVMESLHGDDYEIETVNESIAKLRSVIRDATRKQKVVIIPTFSMDRSAMILRVLNDFLDQGMHFKLVFDTPLGFRMLNSYIDDYNNDSAWFKYAKGFPFRLDRVSVILDYQSHMIASKASGPAVFITSSGMGNGGRVLDYFEHHIQDDKAVFVFPGFLCENTPARRLVEASKGELLEIQGNRYKKNCETVWLHGFSSHGYIRDKIDVMTQYPNASQVYLVHGDDVSIEGTFANIRAYNEAFEHVERNIVIPTYDEVVRLY